MKVLGIVGIVAGVLLVAAVVGLIGALPVMWCWNGFMPAVFDLPSITFWQAFALTVLCSMLFNQGGGLSKD
jgi:hypothetical protein